MTALVTALVLALCLGAPGGAVPARPVPCDPVADVAEETEKRRRAHEETFAEGWRP